MLSEANGNSKKKEKGTKYFHMTAMLMAYLTYEAYINFLGERFAPDIWVNEREFFSKAPYQGIEGKLKKIQERCVIDAIDKGRRPYQTIKKLKDLRDFLSHCKPDKYYKTIIHTRDKEPPLFNKYDKLDTLVTPEKAEIAVADVKEFIGFLHKQASRHTKDIWFGEALEGIRGYSTGESRTKT